MSSCRSFAVALVRVVAICAIVFAGVSCASSDMATNNNANATGTYIASLDGVPWTGSNLTGSFENGGLTISGEANGTTITVAVTTTGPGQFTIGGGGGQGLTFFVTERPSNRTWQAHTSNGTGQVILSSVSSSGAIGSFSFEANANPSTGAIGVRRVSGGSFDLRF